MLNTLTVQRTVDTVRVPVFRPSPEAVRVRADGVSVLWMMTCARPLKAGMVNDLQSFADGWS